MTTLGTDRHRPAPADLLAARTNGPEQLAPVLDAWSLRPLTGGRNNDVFAWSGPDGEVCIKFYRKADQRRRVEREWHALTAVAQHTASDCAPIPLWLDDQADQPALGMSLIPGTPIPDLADITGALKALAEATRAMQTIPPGEPLASLDRIDSAEHYITRLTDVWPQQLADHADDPLTPDMLALLRQWERSSDADTLARPATTGTRNASTASPPPCATATASTLAYAQYSARFPPSRLTLRDLVIFCGLTGRDVGSAATLRNNRSAPR